MDRHTKILYTIVGLLVLAVVYMGFAPSGEQTLGTSVGGAKYIPYKYNFTKGLQVAGSDVFDTSRNLTAVGSTLTGDLIVSGDATFGYGYVKSTGALIEQAVSSTLKIGNDASGLGTGCLVLGDSGGATSTPVYITATGATITATTTTPAICR